MTGLSESRRIAYCRLLLMVFRLYIDEVGNSDLKGAADDPNIRYLALTGILTTVDRHDRAICGRMDQLKALFPAHSTAHPVVFHRREVLRREGPFSALRDPGVGARFDEGLLNLFQRAPYLTITVQIDKESHLNTYGVWHYDPYHYCMNCLVERYVLYLRRHDMVGDVVIEPRYKKADKKLKASFERTCRLGTDNIPARIFEKHLLSRDIGFFPKKANVAGLQLADLLAHPSARHMRLQRDSIPAPSDFGSKVAKILVDRRYARNPQTLRVEGYGTKWLP